MIIERNNFRYNISESGSSYEVSIFSTAWNEWISLETFSSLKEAKMWIDYQIARI